MVRGLTVNQLSLDRLSSILSSPNYSELDLLEDSIAVMHFTVNEAYVGSNPSPPVNLLVAGSNPAFGDCNWRK